MMAKRKRKKALVLGIGNVLLKDEGLGVRAIEYFAERYSFGKEVTCLDGGTSGLGLLSYIKDFSHLIIVDESLESSSAYHGKRSGSGPPSNPLPPTRSA